MAQKHLNGHPAIREGYVKCLASYCLLDPIGEMTKAYLNAFVTFAEKIQKFMFVSQLLKA